MAEQDVMEIIYRGMAYELFRLLCQLVGALLILWNTFEILRLKKGKTNGN